MHISNTEHVDYWIVVSLMHWEDHDINNSQPSTRPPSHKLAKYNVMNGYYILLDLHCAYFFQPLVAIS